MQGEAIVRGPHWSLARAGLLQRFPSALAVPQGRSLTTWAVIGCWLLLVAVDSRWRGYIPAAAALRLVVPLVLVAAVVRSGFRSPRMRGLPRKWLWGFIAVALASVVFSTVPELAGIKLVLYLLVVLPLLHPAIAAYLSPESLGLWRLSQVSLGIMTASVVLCSRYPGGLMLSQNGLGGLALLVTPLMLYNASLPIPSRRKLGRIGVVVCIAAAILGHSRGALIAMWLTFVTYYQLRRGRTGATAVVLTSGLILLGTAYLLVTSGSEYVRDYVYKGDQSKLFDDARQLMFHECIDAWVERPILGYGFGLTHRVKPDDVAKVLATGRLSWFTGELGSSTLGFLVGGGILLLLAFYGFMAVVLLLGLRATRTPGIPAPVKAMLHALIAGLIGLLLAAQSENTLTAPLTCISFLFWLYVGCLLVCVRRAIQEHELVRSPRAWQPDIA